MILPTSRPQGQKGLNMKVKLLGLTVAAVVLSSLYDACVAVGDRAAVAATPPPQAQTTTVGVTAGACSWFYTPAPDGKLQKGSLRVTPPCTIFESQDQLYVSDNNTALTSLKKVLQVPPGPLLFITEGSCRYCYINSSGGMTCIVMPTCP